MGKAFISQFEAELVALDLAVDRARRALGCSFATSDEFEAAFVAARRRQGAFVRPFYTARLIFATTAVTALVALCILAL